MLNFSILNRKINWSCASEVLQRLASRYRDAQTLLTEIRYADTDFKLPSADLGLLSRHPLAQGLLAYRRGVLNEQRAERMLEAIVRIDASGLACLRAGEPSILQLQCLLPESDTRGASIRIVENSRFDRSTLDSFLNVLVDCCGPDYATFLGIVKTISIVRVEAMGELPYFSGCDGDTFGAIHTTYPGDPFVFAETLTHEAAHQWLFLQEEVAELSAESWSGSLWVSPWRADPRPIGGVIHGVFVFSCASLVLSLLADHLEGCSDEATRDRVARRICRLFAQVEVGLGEMDRCPNLTEGGKRIASAAGDRLDSIQERLKPAYLVEARLQCRREQSAKLDKLYQNAKAI